MIPIDQQRIKYFLNKNAKDSLFNLCKYVTTLFKIWNSVHRTVVLIKKVTSNKWIISERRTCKVWRTEQYSV